ncbi:HIT family protein [Neobacillus mesonae]|nr:HIT family protein [Neobacillus mesonae]
MDCLGCKLASGLLERHLIYEDEHISCILDIDPIHEGHVLILPKDHIRELDECDKPLLEAIMSASVLISKALKELYKPDGITVMQNGGVFNDLDHYHMHVFPRYRNDGFGWIEPNAAPKRDLRSVKERIVQTLSID